MTEHATTAEALIALPRRNAHGTLALTSKLLTQARAAHTSLGSHFPHGALKPLERLDTAARALSSALAGSAPSGEDLTVTRAAHQDVDACWAAIVSVLEGWARHANSARPIAKQGKAAELVLATVLPGRLGFTKLGFFEEWSESQTRLHRITPKVERTLHSLGADPLLEVLREAHAAYGKALGITRAHKAPAPPEGKLSPGDAYLEVNSSLRSLVLKLVSARDELSAEHAPEVDALVALVYSDEGVASSSKPAAAEDPPPAPPAAPEATKAAK